jgi:hypothetical protein
MTGGQAIGAALSRVGSSPFAENQIWAPPLITVD